MNNNEFKNFKLDPSLEPTENSTPEEIGNLAMDCGKLLAYFYKDYCVKMDIIPAHEVHNVSIFKTNEELYRIPLVCIRLGDILRFSERREEWAAMLISYWNGWRKQGFSSYESMKRTLDIFTLRWDNNQTFPEIELSAELLQQDVEILDDTGSENLDSDQYEVDEEDDTDGGSL